jgi:predicted metal-dependent enzyme (double-stranded beta helix superfamily)
VTAVDVRIDHLATAARYAADPDSWPVAPRFNPVDRWFHRLAQHSDHEVWLLTWLPGQGTDLHDHGGSSGAFQVVAGELVEDTVADAPALPSSGAPRMTVRSLSEGIGRRFGPRHIHRLTNRSTRPAVSVHVYGPALTTMTRFRIGAAGLDVVSIEKAGLQW